MNLDNLFVLNRQGRADAPPQRRSPFVGRARSCCNCSAVTKSKIELLQQRLCAVYPGVSGSSETVARNLSSARLKTSFRHPVMFLRLSGMALNRAAPLTPRDAARVACRAGGAWCDTVGTWQTLPRRSVISDAFRMVVSSRLGTSSSRICHT